MISLAVELENVLSGKAYKESVLLEAKRYTTTMEEKIAINRYLKGSNTVQDWRTLQDFAIKLYHKQVGSLTMKLSYDQYIEIIEAIDNGLIKCAYLPIATLNDHGVLLVSDNVKKYVIDKYQDKVSTYIKKVNQEIGQNRLPFIFEIPIADTISGSPETFKIYPIHCNFNWSL